MRNKISEKRRIGNAENIVGFYFEGNFNRLDDCMSALNLCLFSFFDAIYHMSNGNEKLKEFLLDVLVRIEFSKTDSVVEHLVENYEFYISKGLIEKEDVPNLTDTERYINARNFIAGLKSTNTKHLYSDDLSKCLIDYHSNLLPIRTFSNENSMEISLDMINLLGIFFLQNHQTAKDVLQFSCDFLKKQWESKSPFGASKKYALENNTVYQVVNGKSEKLLSRFSEIIIEEKFTDDGFERRIRLKK